MKRLVGILVALLVFGSLAATTYRASLESSIWTDEIYSLVLSSHPVQAQWDLSKGDTNPPGFSSLLHRWNRLIFYLGIPKSILTARSLGIFVWLLVIVLVWLRSNALAGWRLAVATVAAVAANAMLATIAKDVRAYIVLSLGILICLYLLHALACSERKAGHKTSFLWPSLLCLALGLTAGLLSFLHLLAPVALCCLFVSWLCVYGLAGRVDRRKCTVILVACGLATLGAAFWIQFIPDQVGFLSSSQVEWMTEPTIRNLFEVFSLWLPFGRMPQARGFVFGALGWLSWMVPLAIGLAATMRRGSETSAARLLGASALLGSLLFVISIWLLSRWNVADVFHAPRYPTIISASFIVGLVYFSLGEMYGGSFRLNLVRVLGLAPLLLCGIYGQRAALAAERLGANTAHLLTESGRTYFLLPSRLMPYFRSEFAGAETHPSSALLCREIQGPATVVDLNPWKSIDSTEDQMMRWLLEREVGLGNVKRRAKTNANHDRVVYDIADHDRLDLRRYCGQGLRSAGKHRLGQLQPVAWGLPEDQVDLASWSFLEISEGLETKRWAKKSKVQVKLRGSIPPGKRTLFIRGYRAPYPTKRIDLKVKIVHGTDYFYFNLGPGPFLIREEVKIEHRVDAPSVVVMHPTWSSAAVGPSEDSRALSFQLREIWIE